MPSCFWAKRLRATIGMALVGLVCILMPFSLSSDLLSKGLAITAGITWAISSIVAKRLQKRETVDLLSFTAWQMLFGSLPLIAIAFLLPSPPVHWTGSFIAALLYNIIPGSAIAWLLWLHALNRLSAGVAGLGTLAVPVVGVLAAWLQLGEQPSLTEAIGMGLIAIALLLNSLSVVQSQRVSDSTAN